MYSSERRLAGIWRRLATSLTNGQQPSESWANMACRMFGEPWLEPVLRAGAALNGRSNEVVVQDEALHEAASAVWSAALDGQERHRRASALRDPSAAAALAAAAEQVHRDVVRLVDEIEACSARLGWESSSSDVSHSDVRDLADRLHSVRLARAEIDACEPPFLLQ